VSRYRDDYLIGFSHPTARHFLLRRLGNCSCVALPLSIDHPLVVASMQSKRKCPKKRRPGCRFILRSSVLSGVGRRGFLPFMPCGYSGWSRQNLRCSARQTGAKTRYCV